MHRSPSRELLLLAALTCCAPPPPPGEEPPPPGQDAGTVPRADAQPRPDASAEDLRPPEVAAVTPADGANDVPLNAEVSVRFDEPIDCSSVSATTLIVRGAAVVAGAVSCAGDTVRFAPAAELAASTPHTASLLPEVRDLAGNTLAAPATWRFTTGRIVDTTPPAAPAISPTPPAQTTQATITVSGTREADSAIEARWLLDGVEQAAWAEEVPLGAATAWSADFSLRDGLNRWELRAKDGAGLTSSTVFFTVQKTANQMTVSPPTVQFTAQTGADRQVLEGTKPAGTALEINGMPAITRGAATSWDLQVNLQPGANHFDLEAVDPSGNRSPVVPVDISYTQPPPVNANGQVKIDFTLQDTWDLVGDEFRMTDTQVEVNHFSVDIWIEGPLNPGERCYYDPANFQRKYTRYVGTVSHSKPPMAPGFFWEPNYFIPNYFAALVEAGHWRNAPNSIPPTVDRRDPAGRTWWYGGSGNCPITWHPNANGCRPNMQTGPVIDGISEPSVNPNYVVATGLAQNGAALGAWSDSRSYRWNLRDRSGQPVRQGTYLLNVLVVLDRGAPAQLPHFNDVWATDLETCWDDPAHDTRGSHRAEGLIVLDGSTPPVVYWPEKGPDERVTACSAPRQGITCNGRCDWGIGDDLNSMPQCPPPNSAASDPSARVKYLRVPSGWPAPVRVEVCPTGACP